MRANRDFMIAVVSSVTQVMAVRAYCLERDIPSSFEVFVTIQHPLLAIDNNFIKLITGACQAHLLTYKRVLPETCAEAHVVWLSRQHLTPVEMELLVKTKPKKWVQIEDGLREYILMRNDDNISRNLYWVLESKSRIRHHIGRICRSLKKKRLEYYFGDKEEFFLFDRSVEQLIKIFTESIYANFRVEIKQTFIFGSIYRDPDRAVKFYNKFIESSWCNSDIKYLPHPRNSDDMFISKMFSCPVVKDTRRFFSTCRYLDNNYIAQDSTLLVFMKRMGCENIYYIKDGNTSLDLKRYAINRYFSKLGFMNIRVEDWLK